MLEYDRIDLSEEINVNKCEDTSKNCSLCQYYYFVFKNFNYQRYLCDGCHDMSVKALSMQHLTIIYYDGQAYRVKSIIIDKKGTL